MGFRLCLSRYAGRLACRVLRRAGPIASEEAQGDMRINSSLLAWISTEARQPNAHPASGSIRSWGDKHLEWLVPSLALAVMCADNYLATVVD
jgi:hypothetical protein